MEKGQGREAEKNKVGSRKKEKGREYEEGTVKGRAQRAVGGTCQTHADRAGPARAEGPPSAPIPHPTLTQLLSQRSRQGLRHPEILQNTKALPASHTHVEREHFASENTSTHAR